MTIAALEQRLTDFVGLALRVRESKGTGFGAFREYTDARRKLAEDLASDSDRARAAVKKLMAAYDRNKFISFEVGLDGDDIRTLKEWLRDR